MIMCVSWRKVAQPREGAAAFKKSRPRERGKQKSWISRISGERKEKWVARFGGGGGNPYSRTQNLCLPSLRQVREKRQFDQGQQQDWVLQSRPCVEILDCATLPSMAGMGDFVSILKQVYRIRMPYFGSLAGGPRYATLGESFAHMDAVVDHSFGQVLRRWDSIWDLERHGLVSPTHSPTRNAGEPNTAPGSPAAAQRSRTR
jgi:hypothetical protein